MQKTNNNTWANQEWGETLAWRHRKWFTNEIQVYSEIERDNRQREEAEIGIYFQQEITKLKN